MAQATEPRYLFVVGKILSRLVGVVAALAAAGAAAADAQGQAPLYTSEDLERMFGPPLPRPSAPVDRSTPEDWRWVEQFLDREYARIDADRRSDLARDALEARNNRLEHAASADAHVPTWRIGYWGLAPWRRATWDYGYATGPWQRETGRSHPHARK